MKIFTFSRVMQEKRACIIYFSYFTLHRFINQLTGDDNYLIYKRQSETVSNKQRFRHWKI